MTCCDKPVIEKREEGELKDEVMRAKTGEDEELKNKSN